MTVPRRTKFLLVAGFVAGIHLAHGAETPRLFERPDAGTGPTQVSVGIWIVDINSIDSAHQSFTADVAVVLQWKDPRLAHSGGGIAHYPLDQIWEPRAVIANGNGTSRRAAPK